MTELELVGLKTITKSDFYENGRESVAWDFSVYDISPLKGRVRSGVYSSLSQKGIVKVTLPEKKFITDENGNKKLNRSYQRGQNHGTIRITELGYSVLDSMKLIDEYGYFIN